MLEVSQLSKTFKIPKKKDKKKTGEAHDPREDGKVFHAVRNVNFVCHPGKVLGLLGMNGAGKTTTLRMLATAIKPTSGTAKMDGVDIVKQPMEVKKRIGFLSGTTGLYGRLTAREMVAYYGRLHGMSPSALAERMAHLFELLDMTSFLDKRNDSLSTGMKQKVSIARSVIHDPPVMFFDEPTSGLDVLSSETVVNFILRCREQGKTVILSTHHMSEVEKLCDDLCVIHHGKVYFSGEVMALKRQTAENDLGEAFKALVRGGGQDA